MKTALFINLFPFHYRDINGVYALGASVKSFTEWDVDYICSNNYKSIFKSIRAIRPSLILYSSLSSHIPWYIKFDSYLKKNFSIPSLIGGPGATFSSDILQRSTIDYVCIGEGEKSIVDFLNTGLTPTQNIFIREKGWGQQLASPVDLDSLPFPNRHFVYNRDSLLRDMATKEFIASRGCPYQCTFCWNHKAQEIYKPFGKIYRRKSVDYLLEEISLVKHEYPFREIVFDDDIFTLDKSWFLHFASEYPARIGLPYSCNVRADRLDEEVVEALKGSGCSDVCWSIESGNENIRNQTLKRAMTEEDIITASKLLHKYKIPFRISNLIGLPGETEKELLDTLELNIKVRPAAGFANTFVPYPGLELTKHAKDLNLIQEESQAAPATDYWKLSTLLFSTKHKKLIHNTMCLFPLFVRNPIIYRFTLLRKALLKMPVPFMRVYYIFYFSWISSKLSYRSMTILHKIRIFMRFAKSVLSRA